MLFVLQIPLVDLRTDDNSKPFDWKFPKETNFLKFLGPIRRRKNNDIESPLYRTYFIDLKNSVKFTETGITFIGNKYVMKCIFKRIFNDGEGKLSLEFGFELKFIKYITKSNTFKSVGDFKKLVNEILNVNVNCKDPNSSKNKKVIKMEKIGEYLSSLFYKATNYGNSNINWSSKLICGKPMIFINFDKEEHLKNQFIRKRTTKYDEGIYAFRLFMPKEYSVFIKKNNGDERILRIDLLGLHSEFETLRILLTNRAKYPELLKRRIALSPLLEVKQSGLLTYLNIFKQFNCSQLYSMRKTIDKNIGHEIVSGTSLFISYCRKDEIYKDEIKNHLSSLVKMGKLEIWDDGEIPPGSDWDKKTNDYLSTCGIIILLISSDFLASEYCFSVELKAAMERHKLGKTTVIPIFVRDCNHSHAPFAGIQGLPRNGKSISGWENPDKAYTSISKEIEELIP